MSSRLLTANVVATGVLFGLLQLWVVLTLESYVASTATILLLTASAWLLGTIAGLLLPVRGRERTWLLAALGAWYGLLALARTHPFETAWLPLLLLLVVVMGGYAGRFFRERAGAFPVVKRLFFLEGCGFVGGIVLTVPALLVAGEAALVWTPLVLGGFVLVTLSLATRCQGSG